MSVAQEMMRKALNSKPNIVLDSVDDGGGLSGADTYTKNDITLKAVASIQQWVESDDLDDGESCADRLLAMVVGIADANKDGEISDEEQAVVDIALNAIWDYLSKYGAEDDDISSLLNDWDDDAAERIKDLLASSMPEDSDADLDNFVFGGGSELADPVFDAVYKKTLAVRGGKKVRINKRISGTVRLSAKQKIGIRKAQMKSHGALAMMHRMKSLKVRKRSGLK